MPSDAMKASAASQSTSFSGKHTPVLSVVLLSLAAAAMFFLTSFVARRHLVHQQELADDWFKRGEESLHAGQVNIAVVDYRTALAFSRDNPLYLLRLAQALAAEGHTNEARAYLLSLFEAEPGNGQVNLELARLAASKDDVENALRFFHGAIYGLWSSDLQARRLEARMELVRFLLGRHDFPRARSELMAMKPDLPKNTDLQNRVAELFLQVSGYADALGLYQRSLELNHGDLTALRGAGTASFKSRDYRAAERYLAEFSRHTQQPDAEAEALLQTCKAVLALNPYDRDLSQEQRNERIMKDFEEVGRQLQQCAQTQGTEYSATSTPLPGEDYARWTAMQPRVTVVRLNHDPGLGDSVLALVADLEQRIATPANATPASGPPANPQPNNVSASCQLTSPADAAMALIFAQPGAQP